MAQTVARYIPAGFPFVGSFKKSNLSNRDPLKHLQQTIVGQYAQITFISVLFSVSQPLN